MSQNPNDNKDSIGNIIFGVSISLLMLWGFFGGQKLLKHPLQLPGYTGAQQQSPANTGAPQQPLITPQPLIYPNSNQPNASASQIMQNQFNNAINPPQPKVCEWSTEPNGNVVQICTP